MVSLPFATKTHYISVNSTVITEEVVTIQVRDLPPLPQGGRLDPPKLKVWLCNGSCHVPFNPLGQQEKPV